MTGVTEGAPEESFPSYRRRNRRDQTLHLLNLDDNVVGTGGKSKPSEMERSTLQKGLQQSTCR